jgi:hypothetical protein
MVGRVNHGVWIASCECDAPRDTVPSPGCVVFLDVPLGWCVRCGNRRHGGFWRPIIIPPPEERRLIEAILDCRPRVEDRNWEPGETVELLAAENTAHGDPVPDLDVIRLGPVHGPSLLDLMPSFPSAVTMQPALRKAQPRRGLRRFLRR